jgi:hypothetical protein
MQAAEVTESNIPCASRDWRDQTSLGVIGLGPFRDCASIKNERVPGDTNMASGIPEGNVTNRTVHPDNSPASNQLMHQTGFYAVLETRGEKGALPSLMKRQV